MDRITDTHVYFWGDPTFSNWGEARIVYKDKIFGNTEQAFMWEKAKFFGDEKIAEEILKNDNPSVAKKLGRKVKNFDNESWIINSFTFMISVNIAKFTQHEKMRKILLSTGDKTIVEASPYDKIWGVGLHWNDDEILDEHKWQGMNLLGKALMEVRTKLKN
jgi:ribA/ribD-fused uncharacterized protein